MKYETKKEIINILLLPIYAISPKLGFYIRGILIQDLRQKIRAIKTHFPEFSFWRAHLMNGGASFCFLIDNKYVIKIKKNYSETTRASLIREKKITDAIRKETSVKVPNITIYDALGYTFTKYDLIDGINLNKIALPEIVANRVRLGIQLGDFIFALHNAGFSHNDLSNNILVNSKMNLAGVIDWEFATPLSERDEIWDFFQLNRKNINKIKQSNLVIFVMKQYYKRVIDEKK